MRQVTFAVLASLVFALLGCGNDMPQNPDGDRFISVVVADTTGTIPGSTPGEPYFLEGAQVSLDSRTHQYQAVTETDQNGVATFENVVAGAYTVFTRAEHQAVSHKVFTGFSDVFIESEILVCDTILVSPILASDLMINEIFYAGSDRSTFYFYDQYVELYNAADDTLYLDGLIVTRHEADANPLARSGRGRFRPGNLRVPVPRHTDNGETASHRAGTVRRDRRGCDQPFSVLSQEYRSLERRL